MSANQNLKIVKRLYEEVFNKGNLSVCDQILANSIAFEDPAIPSFRGSVEKFKQMETVYRTAFPDKKVNIEEISALDNKVLVRWSVKATHTGKLANIQASNRKIGITGISIFHFNNNGKISEIYQNWDRLGLLEQVGALEKLHALHQ